jgi:hypothetical protein
MAVETREAESGRKLLEKCVLFSALDEQVRRNLTTQARPRHFAARELICRVSVVRVFETGGIVI